MSINSTTNVNVPSLPPELADASSGLESSADLASVNKTSSDSDTISSSANNDVSKGAQNLNIGGFNKSQLASLAKLLQALQDALSGLMNRQSSSDLGRGTDNKSDLPSKDFVSAHNNSVTQKSVDADGRECRKAYNKYHGGGNGNDRDSYRSHHNHRHSSQGGSQDVPPPSIEKAFGDVRLDEGGFNAVTLKSGDGTSVKMWGDPHIETVIDGKLKKFDIGHGPGSIDLADGTQISWDTGKNGNTLKEFKVDRPGTIGDVFVDTSDWSMEKGLQTYLTSDQLREFASELENYEGNAHKPLERKNN